MKGKKGEYAQKTKHNSWYTYTWLTNFTVWPKYLLYVWA